jgi:hypothetical protein
MMLSLITSSVSDSLAIPLGWNRSCLEYKVMSCRIRKARRTHLSNAVEVVANA